MVFLNSMKFRPWIGVASSLSGSPCSLKSYTDFSIPFDSSFDQSYDGSVLLSPLNQVSCLFILRFKGLF